MKLKKSDIIIFAIIVILGVTFFIWLQTKKTDGSRVLVTIDGEEYGIYDLNKDEAITIEQANGKKNTFVIKDGYVKMTEASCPDQLCIHQKKIHYNDEMIVCLPNYMVLEVIDGEDRNIDSVVN